MRGEWYTTDGGGGLVPALGTLGGVVMVAWLVLSFLWVIAAIVAVVLVAAVAGLVWLRRHGGEVATVARAALPAPEAVPVESRAARALPAPQAVTINNFYGIAAEQVADAVARQQRIIEGGEHDG